VAATPKSIADRPWLDPDAKPQIVIESINKTFGAFTAVDSVNLRIYKGEMFALVGASGCGKTTLLRMLAGFATPSTGRILIEDVDMTRVPPHERPVNMMFQSYALFPHMTVEDNVGYGLRRMTLDKPVKRKRIQEALEMVQLGALAKRRPHQLSGGQRQRVALARALIRRPKVLLLDEPLSALDKKLREQTQFELMNIQSQVGITFVFVTHDQDEAMALSTRIAVMNRGQVVQIGTPSEIYEFPQTRFVADFIGTTNMFEGTVSGGEPGHLIVRSAEAGCDLIVDELGRFGSGQRVWVALRPEKIRLSKQPIADDRVNREETVAEGKLNLLYGFATSKPGEFDTWMVTHHPGSSRVRPVSVNRLATSKHRVEWEIETAILRDHPWPSPQYPPAGIHLRVP